MNIRTISIIVFTASFFLACDHRQITLDDVGPLPDYVFQSKHFATDMKSIYELNAFILVTGVIDTTTETSPLRLAVIAIDKKNIFLELDTVQFHNGETIEKYSGSGYNLDLTYKEQRESEKTSQIYDGHLIVTYGHLNSGYKIVGTAGYR